MRIASYIVLALVAGCIDKQDDGGKDGSPFRPECEHATDSDPFQFGVKNPDGTGLPPQDEFTLRGVVKSVASSSFTVEGCGNLTSPATNAGGAAGQGGASSVPDSAGTGGNCEQGLWTIEAVGTDLELPLDTGASVSIAYAVWCQPYSGCNSELLVRDEVAIGESLLLALRRSFFGGSTGALSTRLEWPVGMELIDLQCPLPTKNFGNKPATWSLRMTARANPESSLELLMGQSGALLFDPTSDARWLARNLESYDIGGYDSTTRLGFYLVKQR